MKKIAKSRFVPPFGGLKGNVHGSSMARWKARARLPISANWTFFTSSHGWGAMSKYWSKFWFLKGGLSLSTNFRGEGRPPTTFGVRKRVPGLSRGIVSMILCLAVLIQYWRVTHRQTHDDGYYPRIASATRVKSRQRWQRRRVMTWENSELYFVEQWACSKT